MIPICISMEDSMTKERKTYVLPGHTQRVVEAEDKRLPPDATMPQHVNSLKLLPSAHWSGKCVYILLKHTVYLGLLKSSSVRLLNYKTHQRNHCFETDVHTLVKATLFFNLGARHL